MNTQDSAVGYSLWVMSDGELELWKQFPHDTKSIMAEVRAMRNELPPNLEWSVTEDYADGTSALIMCTE